MNSFLLVDDHGIVRAGIKLLLRQQFVSCIIEEAENTDECIAILKIKKFDVIIMDLNMPDSDPFDIIEYITTHQPVAKIIVLTTNSEDVYAKRYFKAGVKGFIHKTTPEADILKAINIVLMGRVFMSESLKGLFAESIFTDQPESPFDKLSNRELQIMTELLHGKSIQQIAALFYISDSTVSTYKAKIYEKLLLQNNNLIGLIELAKRYNLLRDRN